MKRTIITLAVVATALTAAACGRTMEQRAATGAVAGPVGAAVGGAAGAAVSRSNNEPD